MVPEAQDDADLPDIEHIEGEHPSPEPEVQVEPPGGGPPELVIREEKRPQRQCQRRMAKERYVRLFCNC